MISGNWNNAAQLPFTCYLGHALMENRNGLAVDVETTQASGTAERDAAKTMMIRSIRTNRATLGAEKGYDVHGFVQAVRDRGVTPHVAKKTKGSAIDVFQQPVNDVH